MMHYLDLRGITWWGIREECIMRSFHNSYTSPNTVREIKSRRRWVGHAACMGEMINAYKILVRKP
jgi:hypothetical protein